jgi:hypothetical protein
LFRKSDQSHGLAPSVIRETIVDVVRVLNVKEFEEFGGDPAAPLARCGGVVASLIPQLLGENHDSHESSYCIVTSGHDRRILPSKYLTATLILCWSNAPFRPHIGVSIRSSASSIPLGSTSKHAPDDLGRSRRGGHSRQFDRKDAAFTRYVAGMNVAAQCFDRSGDDGQAQPRPGTLSGAANERYEQAVCGTRGKAATLVLHFDDETVVQASCT